MMDLTFEHSPCRSPIPFCTKNSNDPNVSFKSSGFSVPVTGKSLQGEPPVPHQVSDSPSKFPLVFIKNKKTHNSKLLDISNTPQLPRPKLKTAPHKPKNDPSLKENSRKKPQRHPKMLKLKKKTTQQQQKTESPARERTEDPGRPASRMNKIITRTLKRQREKRIHKENAKKVDTQYREQRKEYLKSQNRQIRKLNYLKFCKAEFRPKVAWGADERKLSCPEDPQHKKGARALSVGKKRAGFEMYFKVGAEIQYVNRSRSCEPQPPHIPRPCSSALQRPVKSKRRTEKKPKRPKHPVKRPAQIELVFDSASSPSRSENLLSEDSVLELSGHYLFHDINSEDNTIEAEDSLQRVQGLMRGFLVRQRLTEDQGKFKLQRDIEQAKNRQAEYQQLLQEQEDWKDTQIKGLASLRREDLEELRQVLYGWGQSGHLEHALAAIIDRRYAHLASVFSENLEPVNSVLPCAGSPRSQDSEEGSENVELAFSCAVPQEFEFSIDEPECLEVLYCPTQVLPSLPPLDLAVLLLPEQSVPSVGTDPASVVNYTREVFQAAEGISEFTYKALNKSLQRDVLGILTKLQETEIGSPLDPEFPSFPPILPVELYLTLENPREGGHCKGSLISEAEHIHNKLIFDATNESLQKHRPYGLTGPPLPWSSTTRISAPPIPLSSLQSQVLYQIEHWSRTQTGLIPTEEEMTLSDEDFLQQTREEKLIQALTEECKVTDALWISYEFEEVQVKLDVADMVLEHLTGEAIQLLWSHL